MVPILLLLLLHAQVDASLPIVPNNRWNPALALGKWYQLADVPQFYETTYTFCTTAMYELLPNSSVLITNMARDAPSPTAQTCVVYGTGTPSSPQQLALWNIALWGNPCSFPSPTPIYATLAWNFVYSENPNQPYQLAILSGPGNSVYVLSRSPYISDKTIQVMTNFYNQHPGFAPRLTPTVQNGCW